MKVGIQNEAFLTKTSEVLADTQNGLSGPQIVKYMSDFAVDFGVDIPYVSYPFPKELSNKRTALKENLKVFDSVQQFKIILFLCELDVFKENDVVNDLRIKLLNQYGELNIDNIPLDQDVITTTRHWLEKYPESLKLYNESIKKLQMNIFQRNLLDDLRLSLEKLLCGVLNNTKSLENQQTELGKFIKDKNSSKELQNMFLKLIDYYTKYHNEYIKHDDKVNENEVEIIFELTSSMMKFIVRLSDE